MSGKIYLDHAATSWPKPPAVLEAVKSYLEEIGANPGRSGHSASVEGARVIYNVREKVAGLFHHADPLSVIFTHNISEALNLALKGVLGQGDHVIAGSMEHNSMMRPLRALEKDGIELSVVQFSAKGEADPDDFRKAVRSNTKMIAVNHASNVNGAVIPLRDIGRVAREHNLLLLLDSAQTAGVLPIEMEADCVDLLAFTGHKSLYGLPGTGGLIIGGRVDITAFRPLKHGGTGSRSELEEQPDFLPDKLESGTCNFTGLAALGAGIDWLRDTGMSAIRKQGEKNTRYLLNKLERMNRVRVMTPRDIRRQTATVSFLAEDRDPAEIGFLLDEKAGILCRTGLHCAPAAHHTLGTFPEGTVRVSMGYFNTTVHIDRFAEILERIIRERL